MPVTRGRPMLDELETVAPRVPRWQERLGLAALAALVAAMMFAMWRIMTG